MIHSVAKDLIKIFNINQYIETGIFKGESLKIVHNWFEELYPMYMASIGYYEIFEIDLDRQTCDDAIKNFGILNENIHIINESSEKYLSTYASFHKNDYNKCLFYLDAHWNDYWPLRDEIKEVIKLSGNKPIILIDDFKIPGTNIWYYVHPYGSLDADYIKDLIEPYTDTIYYTKEASESDRGSAIIFLGRNDNEINPLIKDLPIIKEAL